MTEQGQQDYLIYLMGIQHQLGLDSQIERFKARLVARGNEQSDDDFEEMFALVF